MKQKLIARRIKKIFKIDYVASDLLGGIALFDKLGLAYNRIQKNANTSAMILLRELETGRVEDRAVAKEKAKKLSAVPYWGLSGLSSYKFFVIVRNPYSRVLSAFLDKFRVEKYRIRYGDFSLDPDGFAQFVKWLSEGGLGLNSHWGLQVDRLLLPIEKYHGVIRFESLQDDMRSFLASQCIILSEDALAELYPSDIKKKTSASGLVQEFYSAEVAELVFQLYKKDFKDLGYSSKLGVESTTG